MNFRLSRLALLLALSIVVTSVVGIGATWWVAEREFRDVLDDDLESQSELLARILTDGEFEYSAQALAELLDELYESDDEDAIWVTVYDLETGDRVSNIRHEPALTGDTSGTIDLEFDGHGWHGYQQREDGIVVQMLRRNDLYRDLQEETLEDIVMPVLAGGSISLLILLVLIGLSLWPVMRLARQVEARSPDSLSPVVVRTPAREIRVLADALNKLIRDVESVLARERQFVSDVAHELRNPLTTFAVELADEKPDLAALKAESRRLTTLVEQLLTLARIDQRHWHRRFEPVALHEICARVIGRFTDDFSEAQMPVESKLSPVTVRGDSALLETLCRNLLLNALRHCPHGTEVHVESGRLDDAVRLRISDTGPGIDAAIRAQMSDGIARLDSKSEGLGLGLAICQRIARVHGASIEFAGRTDGASGLVVDILFPD